MSKVDEVSEGLVKVEEVVSKSESQAVFVKGVKADFDIKEFKKSGKVVATFQISAGNDVRYNFKAIACSMDDETGCLVFPDGFTSESFVDCEVYIPSLKHREAIAPTTVFHELMAQVTYDYFRCKFEAQVKEKRENAGSSKDSQSSSNGTSDGNQTVAE